MLASEVGERTGRKEGGRRTFWERDRWLCKGKGSLQPNRVGKFQTGNKKVSNRGKKKTSRSSQTWGP